MMLDLLNDLQQPNGEDHSPPPRGNTNPQFSSVLPSTTPLEFRDDVIQATQLGAIRGLDDPGIYQRGITLRGLLPGPSGKAKELELAGEVALFREIMKAWDCDDRRASAVLGYREPTFATDLFKGLVSIRQRDAEGRLLAIVSMAADLEALYRDLDVIQKWLKTPQNMLDGMTPLKLLTEGSSEDLTRVTEYVEYLSGR